MLRNNFVHKLTQHLSQLEDSRTSLVDSPSTLTTGTKTGLKTPLDLSPASVLSLSLPSVAVKTLLPQAPSSLTPAVLPTDGAPTLSTSLDKHDSANLLNTSILRNDVVKSFAAVDKKLCKI